MGHFLAQTRIGIGMFPELEQEFVRILGGNVNLIVLLQIQHGACLCLGGALCEYALQDSRRYALRDGIKEIFVL